VTDVFMDRLEDEARAHGYAPIDGAVAIVRTERQRLLGTALQEAEVEQTLSATLQTLQGRRELIARHRRVAPTDFALEFLPERLPHASLVKTRELLATSQQVAVARSRFHGLRETVERAERSETSADR